MRQLSDDSLFYKLYHAWIARMVAPKYGLKISYSAHPKMRVHLAGTGSVSETRYGARDYEPAEP
jgi:hypothetical protein